MSLPRPGDRKKWQPVKATPIERLPFETLARVPRPAAAFSAAPPELAIEKLANWKKGASIAL